MCKVDTDFDPGASCTDLETGGVQGKLYLINYADWLTANVTRDAVTGAVTAIVLTETGAKATEYLLPEGAVISSTPMTDNPGGKSGFAHALAAFMPTKDSAIRQELASLMNYGRVVGIIVLDSSIVSQIYGSDSGLKLTAFEEANNDPSKGGGFDATFGTPTDVTLENLPPVEFFDTDRATTLAALTTLKTPVA